MPAIDPSTHLGSVVRRTFKTWFAGNAIHWGAGLAYYSLISLGPVLLLLVGTAGLVLDAGVAGRAIVGQLEPVLGRRGASVAETVLREGSFPGFNSPQAIVSILLLLVGATAVFANLRAALNAIWSVCPTGGGLRRLVRTRFVAFLMILVVGGLVTTSVVLSAVIALVTPWLELWFPGGSLVVSLLDFALSAVLLWVAFAAVFRILPDARIGWRDVWAGALATALLFSAGKFVLSFYLSHSNLGSTYGAAGSVFVLMVWLYYSAQVLLLGATFTQVLARARGRRIEPEDHATWVLEQERSPE